MKLPWEKDPHDHEANYRKPVPVAERVRVAIKAAAVVGAGVAFRFATLDRTHEGAKLLIAVGAALLVAGITDLVYMRTHELELIFLTSPRQQRLVHAGVTVAGVLLLVAGALAYAG